MTRSFGPWATAASAGSKAHLSTFWKRRLAMLPATHRSRSRLGGGVILLLSIAAGLVWAVPTLRGASAQTQQERPAAGPHQPATNDAVANVASAAFAPPTLRSDSGSVASADVRARVLKVNGPWLWPQTHPRSYTFSMKHTDEEDRWEALVEFDLPEGMSIRPGPNSKEVFPAERGRLERYDLEPVILGQAVRFFGPLHRMARSPDAYQIRVVGDGKAGRVEARVLHLRPAKPDEGTYPDSLIRRVYPLRIECGCGIWHLSYGDFGAVVEVDQIWVEKATGRVLREEGFVQGQCRFLIQYSDYEKVSDTAAVPRHVVLTLFDLPSDPPGFHEGHPWVFDMKFTLHEGKVWLLKELTEWQAGKKVATAEVRDVKTTGGVRSGTALQPARSAGKAGESNAAGAKKEVATPAPPPPADNKVEPKPQSAEALERLYALGDGEVLKRVPPPFSPSRLVYYRERNPTQAEYIPEAPGVMLFRFHEGQLKGWGLSGAADLPWLLRALVDFYPQQIEGDVKLIRTKIDGDWIVREGTPLEGFVGQMNEILRRECKLPIKLSLREMEREVVVAKGELRLMPLRDRRIDIYRETLMEPARGGGGSGDFEQFLQCVGMFIGRRVVSDVKDPPKTALSWHYNSPLPSASWREKADIDEDIVLKHVTEQTGLRFTKEKRRVRVLFVEKVD